MKIKGIKYTGPIFDSSGYAKACRGNILALHAAGIPITLNPISFENIKPDFGDEGILLNNLIGKRIEYNINLIHSTPEFWHQHREDDKINYGFTIWETTKLHPDWPKYINNGVDKVLVGCNWNKEVFKESGVTIPIGVVPHCIDIKNNEIIEPYNIAGVSDNDFAFYFIGQWTERKHMTALIKAYFNAFTGVKDVVLILKTHRNDYNSQEKEVIRSTIKRLKYIMPLDHYPKISYISDMLTDNEIKALHKRGDCYLSLDRGEGFGLSTFEAGFNGNPIVITGFGGATEYAKKDNSYLVDYSLTPVFGMPWSPWYQGSQMWAEPNLGDAIEKMKHVYNNREEAKEKGLKLKKYIEEGFSFEAIANKIIKEIEEI